MPLRCRNAASTVAACEVIIGEPSAAHFGAMTADASSPISTALAAMSSSRRWDRSSNAVCPAVIDSTMERQRSSRPGRGVVARVLAREQLLVVDLIEDDRRVALGGPYLRGTAAPAPLRRIQREDAQQAMERGLRHRPDEQDVDEIAIVEHRRGFGDGGLVAVRFGAFDHQRLGRNAQRERGAPRRLLDGVREAFDRRAHRRVLGRIERPVAHGGEQRAREQQQPLGELGRELGGLGHAANYTGARVLSAECWVLSARARCWVSMCLVLCLVFHGTVAQHSALGTAPRHSTQHPARSTRHEHPALSTQHPAPACPP